MKSAADPQWWSDRILCMIGPDCLNRRLLGPVLDRLRSVRLVPAGWRYVQVGQTQIDAVSAAQDAGPDEVYRYRAMDALFALGPVVLLVLRDQGDGDRDSAELYRIAAEVKGHSDPRRAAAGTIRHDLGSINVVMSLLHLSDSPDHSAAEWALLNPAGDLVEQSPDGFRTVLEAARPAETRLFPEVLSGVRSRLLARLWAALTPAGRRLAQDLITDGALADAKSGHLLAQEVTETGHLPLAQVLRTPFDADAGEPPPDLDRIGRLLRLHQLDLDPWEKTVLTTSSYFPPVR